MDPLSEQSQLRIPGDVPKLSDAIRTGEFRGAISAELEGAGLGADSVLLVPSVQDWASAHGIDRIEPFCSGMAARSEFGAPLVVLADLITADMQESVLAALEIRNFGEESQRLRIPHAFLEHLVLHEIAHLLLPPGATESECDRWAFDRLKGSWLTDAA